MISDSFLCSLNYGSFKSLNKLIDCANSPADASVIRVGHWVDFLSEARFPVNTDVAVHVTKHLVLDVREDGQRTDEVRTSRTAIVLPLILRSSEETDSQRHLFQLSSLVVEILT